MRRSDERGAARVHVQLHAGQLPRDGVERADEPAVADGLCAEGRLLRVGGEEQQRGAEEAVERDLVFLRCLLLTRDCILLEAEHGGLLFGRVPVPVVACAPSHPTGA